MREQLNTVQTYDEFLDCHTELAESLQRFWLERQGDRLGDAYLYKLIDLFIKALSKVETDFQNLNANLVQYGHIPLDQWSLIAVRNCFYGIVIADQPRMGLIDDYLTYMFIQPRIRELMNDAGLPNLYFDYYAWDDRG